MGTNFNRFVAGKDAAMDVTIVTPLQAATMPGAANTAGHGLDHAYGRKINGAEQDCRRQGIAVLPMVKRLLVAGTLLHSER